MLLAAECICRVIAKTREVRVDHHGSWQGGERLVPSTRFVKSHQMASCEIASSAAGVVVFRDLIHLGLASPRKYVEFVMNIGNHVLLVNLAPESLGHSSLATKQLE